MNTEATPSEIEAAQEAIGDHIARIRYETTTARAVARVALNAAYAIRLPPLYAELERYREALEHCHCSCDGVCELRDIARQALEEQSK